MKKEKKEYKLDDLKVKSLLTLLPLIEEQRIKGGLTGPGSCQWKTGDHNWC